MHFVGFSYELQRPSLLTGRDSKSSHTLERVRLDSIDPHPRRFRVA